MKKPEKKMESWDQIDRYWINREYNLAYDEWEAYHKQALIDARISQIEECKIEQYNPHSHEVTSEKAEYFVHGARSAIKHFNAFCDERIAQLKKEKP